MNHWQPQGTVYGTLLNFRREWDFWVPKMTQDPHKAAPQAPVLYVKSANTFNPGKVLTLQDGIKEVDIGACLGLVMGEQGHVEGVVLLNDWSVPHSSYFRPPVKFRCRDGYLGCGVPPVPLSALDMASLSISVQVNGQRVQTVHLSDVVRPMDRLLAGLPAAIAQGQMPDAQAGARWMGMAHAIMTTDTAPKVCSRAVTLSGHTVNISGIAKGAGMIRPNMATMLGFIATDACIDASVMPTLARELAEGSFNRVTVDGDTSTNDSLLVIASNKAGNPTVTDLDAASAAPLKHAMLEVARKLAQAIVRDGEGATKFISVQVEGGGTEAECRLVAYAIAHSPLVKTAFFASDPNLGRILAAVGYAGIQDLDQSLIELFLDDVHVATRGGRNPAYREEDGQRVMKQSEITVRVHLGRGAASQTVWTCDFSHDYVTINADYRS